MRGRCNRFLSSGIAAVFLCFVFASLAMAQGDIARTVLEQINAARASAGLAPLVRNSQLDAAAQGHAQELDQFGTRLGHAGPEGSSIRQRIARTGYASANVGENWASYRSIALVMQFWLNDPPHRRNILNAKFQEIGIGVVARSGGGLILVTDFGSSSVVQPAAQALPSPVPDLSAQPTTVPPKPTRAVAISQTPIVHRSPTPLASPAANRPAVVQAALSSPPTVTQYELRAGGSFAASALRANADFTARLRAVGDPMRMSIGGIMATSGVLLLGLTLRASRGGQRK